MPSPPAASTQDNGGEQREGNARWWREHRMDAHCFWPTEPNLLLAGRPLLLLHLQCLAFPTLHSLLLQQAQAAVAWRRHLAPAASTEAARRSSEESRAGPSRIEAQIDAASNNADGSSSLEDDGRRAEEGGRRCPEAVGALGQFVSGLSASVNWFGLVPPSSRGGGGAHRLHELLVGERPGRQAHLQRYAVATPLVTSPSILFPAPLRTATGRPHPRSLPYTSSNRSRQPTRRM
nr:unnamed protein product [Digitaria exilis]